MGTVLAFLQARMGSTRLPGKVLLRIQGKTLLEHAVWRLRAARTLAGVMILTTTLEEDNQIAAEGGRLGTPVHRGPELDVLRRYQQASERFGPGIIVRATADNPLIDIGSVDRIVCALRSGKFDYCMESGLPVGAATEAITAGALLRSDQDAREDRHREHVTLYAKEHPEKFRLAFLEPPGTLRNPGLRLTVDTPEDFVLVEELIRALPESTEPHPLERYLDFATRITRAWC